MAHWTIDYVRHVLEQKQMRATNLARELGLSPATLTRPLNEKNSEHASISTKTIQLIADLTGIDPKGFSIEAETIPPAPWRASRRGEDVNEMSISVQDGRAHIHARIDAEGLRLLQQKLEALAVLLDP